MWGEIHSALGKSRIAFPEALKTELKLGPTRYAVGLSTSVTKQDEGVRFQGFHAPHILFILDEAPGIAPEIHEAIEGARAGGDVRILQLGNPTISSGTFYDIFKEQRTGWNLFTISAFDTPNLQDCYLEFEDEEGVKIRVGHGQRNLLELSEDERLINPLPYLTTKQWVFERYHELGPNDPVFQARVLGQFPNQSQDSLLSLAWIEAARIRDLAPSDRDKIRIGIDVAGPGEDETVLTAVRGPRILVQKGWAKADPRGEVVAMLNELGRENIEAVNVDCVGIGWGMYLHLQDLGFPVFPINVGEEPTDKERFFNLKAELYWGLRERYKGGDVCGEIEDKAVGQLGGIRWKLTPAGKIQIESKEEARKRGVKSPDRAESIMLAYARVYRDGAGLLEHYKALAAPKPADEAPPKPEGVRPPPKEEPKVTTPATRAYANVFGAMVTKETCSRCGNPLGPNVVTDGFKSWHPECDKPAWAR